MTAEEPADHPKNRSTWIMVLGGVAIGGVALLAWWLYTNPDRFVLTKAVILSHDSSKTITLVAGDPKLEQLEGFFPGYRRDPSSSVAGGWIRGYTITFHFEEAPPRDVMLSSDGNGNGDWSMGQGDFPTIGGPSAPVGRRRRLPTGRRPESARWTRRRSRCAGPS